MQRIAACLVLAAILAGCVGASPSTPTASEQPTPKPTGKATSRLVPTVTAEPTPTYEDEERLEAQLVAACKERPVAWAAPYAGKVHPLVVAEARRSGDVVEIDPFAYPDNVKWYANAWSEHLSGTSQIQLVICIGDPYTERVDSCGNYTRADGVTGEVVLSRIKRPVRVVVAKTGQVIQEEDLIGADRSCQGGYNWLDGAQYSGDPPWSATMDPVTQADIIEYVTAVSKQPVK